MNFNYDHAVLQGASLITYDGTSFNPYEYTNSREELLAARSSAWLGCSLNMPLMGRTEIWGPDAAEFLNRICVNRDFNKLKVGGSRHALICNDKGQLMNTGVVERISDDCYRTFCLFPTIIYYLETTDLDVQYKVVEEYFYQIDGPRSLEIMEDACQCDLHDLKFAQNKNVKIAGTDMFIHRLGMSGALAYEMHGAPEDSETVYNTILEAGKKYGLKQLGDVNYTCNHTSGGYPNQFLHFAFPYNERGCGKELSEFINFPPSTFSGTAADDEDNYYVTPYDVGWGNLVKFDHDFPGREALEKIAENPPRKVVTLEWNLDDVAAIRADEIRGIVDEDLEIEAFRGENPSNNHADKVVADGAMIGVAVGRVIDYYYHSFISLAYLKPEYAVEGTDVTVMWGKAAGGQREIRAKVARFPYFNEEYRNETYDVIANVPRKYA